MKSKLLLLPLLILAFTSVFQSCDDDETYADKRKREEKQIQAFLSSGVEIKIYDQSETFLSVPGNIKVISEAEFFANDSTTDVSKNEYVKFDQTGVYMQILDKGTGTKLNEGEKDKIIARYIEVDLTTDSILTTNYLPSSEEEPDIMSCSNSLGIYTGTFLQGRMMNAYKTAAVPAGWLVPFPYINFGRLDSETATLSHVRLIVPSSQGQPNASANVYPCFYDIKFQRGR